MKIDQSKPVLVTGANGYIASWLVKYLLEQGVDVHATVRDPSNSSKVAHLLKLAEQAEGKLTLFAANLLEDGSFDEAMKGCCIVFHTASPFVVRGLKDPYQELVVPAKQGTQNVLDAANRTKSVKKIVLTSSVAAIYGDAVDMQATPNGVFTEAQWNTSSSVEHQPYSYSKLEAEKTAWDIHKKQNRWKLVVVNPGLVMGPSLTTQSDSTSLSMIKELLDGTLKAGAPELHFGMVDVRDVAMAHIHAAYIPRAQGRHILVSDSMSMMEIAKTLKTEFGSRFSYPLIQAPKFMVWLIGPFQGVTRKFVKNNVGYPLKFDNTHTRVHLDMEFRPLKVTLVDHAQQMIDDGILA